MFSWITGPRLANAIEDLQPENNFETTFVEPPETPAHQFAVKAFKHAIFGTPAPEDAANASKRIETKVKDKLKAVQLPAPKEEAPPISPSKLPGGILMTPGTVSKGRKTVSFGSQVVDNEGKRGNTGKSGIPNDCPGKFPSPWTPGTQLKLEPSSDQRPRTKLTEALLDARTTTQPKSGQKPKARDDSDITIDLGAPRSESGKYWKEQYESYAERSEKEMKKIIAKQQLAKKYAMKKDAEAIELVTKLEQERKHHKQQEKEWEQRTKSLEENLREARAENTSSNIEIAALKARITALESSIALPSSEIQSARTSFHIYEDTGKEVVQQRSQAGQKDEHSFVPSLSLASSGKENTPTPRLSRRRSMPQSLGRPSPSRRLSIAEDEVSIMFGKSPRRSVLSTKASAEQTSTSTKTKSPFNSRKIESDAAKLVPGSPVPVLPSSPLPMPSPDPWLEVDGSSIQQLDRMALPVSSGVPYSRPEWNPPPKQPRVAKSNAHAKQLQTSTTSRHQRSPIASTKENYAEKKFLTQEDVISDHDVSVTVHKALGKGTPKVETAVKLSSVAPVLPIDPKFDLSKITTHHAEGSTQVKQEQVDILSDERKLEARRRLAERKKLRKNAAA